MKRLWLLLLTLGSGPACQIGCNDAGCGCGSPDKPGYYDIEGVSLAGINSSIGSGGVLTAGGSVPQSLFKLYLTPVTRYFTSHRGLGGSGLAWACSPMPTTFVERVDSVLVRSRYAYDAQHPAGTPLNDLLLGADAPGYNSQPLTDYLRQRGGQPEERLSLQLRVPPAAAGPQQFVVRYRLTNGEVHTAETPVFTLEP